MFGKKGSFLDIMFIVIVVLIMGIGAVASQFMLKNINKEFDNPHFTEIADKGEVSLSVLNMAIPVLLIGSFLVSVILAFFIRTHPVLFGISFLILLVFVVITAQISNLWVEFTQYSGFTSIVNNMPILFWTLKNLPLIMLGLNIVLAIAMYSGNPRGGGYNV